MSYTYTPEFKGHWSNEDKELWKKTDWQERNYNELPVEDDKLEYDAVFWYMSNGKMESITKKLQFVKYIRPNERFEPYYGPVYTPELLEFMREGHYCYPMFDGQYENGYGVHNRFEDSTVNDILSR